MPRTLLVALTMLCGAPLGALACWNEVAQRHGVPTDLLYAVAKVESGLNPKAVNRSHIQRTGSIDIGLMQINSIHPPRLLKQGITEERLINEPCLSVEVGASILAEFIQRFGYNWTAVGSYNVGTGSGPEREALRMRYAQKIWAYYEQLVAHRY